MNVAFFFEGEEEAGSPHLRELLRRHRSQLGADAARIYSAYVESGEAGKDFSGIIRFVRG